MRECVYVFYIFNLTIINTNTNTMFLLNQRFIGDLLKEYGKIAEKSTFCCFDPGIHGITKIDLHVFFYKHMDFRGQGQIFLTIFQKCPKNMLSIFLTMFKKMPKNMLSIFLAEIFGGICRKRFSIQNARMISTFPSILKCTFYEWQ